MTTFREHLNEMLEDEGFRQIFKQGEGEYQARRALILAREAEGVTQQELAAKSGVSQKSISKIETGSTNVSVETLAKLANGLGRKLRIEFV